MSMKQKNAAYPVAALAALAAIGGVGVTARAQTTQPYPPSPGAPAAMQGTAREAQTPTNDIDFVRMLAAANTTELDMAKFMINRTASPTVRTFAQQMIDDHSTAAVKLQAATRGVTPAAPPARVTTAAGQRDVEMLAMLSGPQRDAQYMRMQVAAHRNAIALLEWESQKGKVASLKALAVELLPTVETHARMALAYQATGGTSMAVDVAAPAATSPSGTLPNNPATTSGGQTTGAANAAGASRSTNTITSPSRPPTLSQPTPAPNQPASPQPSATPY
ncbi:MAG TPA: DUF4142 domain-containing protein [Candidatus Limnocylindria bacterium]|jgi:putative membrane protein|nr:DUF4142 domain-containing protein [Candidatus Limnocylindria bacterium]